MMPRECEEFERLTAAQVAFIATLEDHLVFLNGAPIQHRYLHTLKHIVQLIIQLGGSLYPLLAVGLEHSHRVDKRTFMTKVPSNAQMISATHDGNGPNARKGFEGGLARLFLASAEASFASLFADEFAGRVRPFIDYTRASSSSPPLVSSSSAKKTLLARRTPDASSTSSPGAPSRSSPSDAPSAVAAAAAAAAAAAERARTGARCFFG